MNRAAPVLLTLALACPVQALAGAWPRGEGNSFATLSWRFEVGEDAEASYGTLYYEYGLAPRLTFGLDAGGDPATRDTSVIAFVRGSISAPEATDQFAWVLGAGWADGGGGGDARRAVLRPGLSWGRGWEVGGYSGWAGVDATYAFRDDGDNLAKIDTTFGVNHAGGALSFLQVQMSRPSGEDLEIALAPAHVVPLSDSLQLELGGDYSFATERASIKLGIWTSF